jgi:hypothetical protein
MKQRARMGTGIPCGNQGGHGLGGQRKEVRNKGKVYIGQSD